jgi:hypothetical protein
VSKDIVAQHIKDYYAHSFGIRVLDRLPVHEFFRGVNASMDIAVQRADTSRDNIHKVLYEGRTFADDYLRVENSFFEIIASISAIGLGIGSPKVVELIGRIIERKTAFTNEYNAWSQYTQLAKWLLHLCCILELRGSSIEAVFLSATLRSMTTMRSMKMRGYSWHAYQVWSSGWSNVKPSNRGLIRAYVESKTPWADAIAVVRSA